MKIYTQFLVFILGIVLLGLGIDIFILSGFGASPWDAANFTLAAITNTSPGLWIFLSGIILTCITLIIAKNKNLNLFLKSIITILSGFLLGFSVNIWLMLLENIFPHIFILGLAGIPFVAIGVLFITKTTIPQDPISNFMSSLIINYNLSILKARYITDGTGIFLALISGFVYFGFLDTFHNFLGAGTIIIFFLLAPCMKFINTILIKIPLFK